jgi:hypothetical protein
METEYVDLENFGEEIDGEMYERTRFAEDLDPSKTGRGFGIINFLDAYRTKCSLQESSLATEGAIWLGVDDVQPQIMASEAHLVGLETEQTTGWVDYPVPEKVLMHSRMHLTQEQVKQLLPVLQEFAETGYLPRGEEDE